MRFCQALEHRQYFSSSLATLTCYSASSLIPKGVPTRHRRHRHLVRRKEKENSFYYYYFGLCTHIRAIIHVGSTFSSILASNLVFFVCVCACYVI